MLDTLSTEADLNNVLDIPTNVPLEDEIILFGNVNTELDTQATTNVMTELNSPVNNNIIHNNSNDCTHKSPTPPFLSTTSTSVCVRGRDNDDDQNNINQKPFIHQVYG